MSGCCDVIQGLSYNPSAARRFAHEGTKWELDVQLYSFFNLGARSGYVANARPRPFTPPGMTSCPLYRKMGGPQGRSGRMRRASPPPGFDPRTIQPVVNRYTG